MLPDTRNPLHFRKWVLATAAVVVMACSAAQPTAGGEFDVVSIKKNDSGPPRAYVNPFVFSAGGRFIARNVTLPELIALAYQTRSSQMQGGPDWMDSARFNIAAKAGEGEADVKPEQIVSMLQALLKDRFKLKLHKEMEERTVYALIAGKTPPRLQTAKEGEQTAIVPGERGQMNFQGMPMDGLVNALANIFHTPVVDATGIKGLFDFSLDPMRFAIGLPGASAIYPNLVVRALRDQLGLALEKRQAHLEITVIDSAEQPSDN